MAAKLMVLRKKIIKFYSKIEQKKVKIWGLARGKMCAINYCGISLFYSGENGTTFVIKN
jgi:hypothetical protein